MTLANCRAWGKFPHALTHFTSGALGKLALVGTGGVAALAVLVLGDRCRRALGSSSIRALDELALGIPAAVRGERRCRAQDSYDSNGGDHLADHGLTPLCAMAQAQTYAAGAGVSACLFPAHSSLAAPHHLHWQ